MPMNTNVSTEGLEQMPHLMPVVAPSLDAPQKSPFYIGQYPVTATTNSDALRNFHTPNIPSYRIVPPIPLTAASGGTNATATVTTAPVLLQPTPAPSIASPLVTIPTGFTFSFNQVRLPLSSTLAISTYKVYRGSANNSASATVIQSIPHHPAGLGVPVVIQDNQVNGVVAFYWVSAVSTSGQESTLTPAQAAGVTSNAIANANSQLAGSFHGVANNTTMAPLQSSVLSNTGGSTIITVNSSVMATGDGNVSYNSGSVDPGSSGTKTAVFGDDPTFSGGSIPYAFTISGLPFSSVDANGNANFGIITPTIGTASTGGGFSGGSGGATAIGGKGYQPI